MEKQPPNQGNEPVISQEENRQLQERYRARTAKLYKEGAQFDLSPIFPPTDELGELIDQVDDLKRCLGSFRPLDPVQVRKLEEALNVEYAHESTRIEGNTLTLQETSLVIGKDMTIGGKSLREHLEVINHSFAFDFVKDLVRREAEFTPLELRSLHQLVLTSIDRENAGRYRTVDVAIQGSRHRPPPVHLVQQEMDEYFEFYEAQKDKLHPVILAAEMHDRLVTVHPFADGNGRTARLVMNLMLLRHGYVIANISGERAQRDAYYDALETSHSDGDPEPFHRLIAKEGKQTFFWYLGLVPNSYDETRGAYFFNRIREYLE